MQLAFRHGARRARILANGLRGALLERVTRIGSRQESPSRHQLHRPAGRAPVPRVPSPTFVASVWAGATSRDFLAHALSRLVPRSRTSPCASCRPRGALLTPEQGNYAVLQEAATTTSRSVAAVWPPLAPESTSSSQHLHARLEPSSGAATSRPSAASRGRAPRRARTAAAASDPRRLPARDLRHVMRLYSLGRLFLRHLSRARTRSASG